ncbi:MAG: hypothetical protein LQ350_005641 [Teloschistes chrysophthalmus]|nr:MAG: hypothetical protein LQ350_005641 [Niorma chrysophthalma]
MVDFQLDKVFDCPALLSELDVAKVFEEPSSRAGTTYYVSKDALMRVFKNRSLELWNQLSASSIARLCHVLDTAVWLASTLTFTDWDTGLRTIAAQYFQCSGELYYTPDSWIGCLYIIKACTHVDEDTRIRKLQNFASDGLARDFDGVIILRTLAVSPEIHKAQGKIYSLLAGHIAFQGQQIEHVSVEPLFPLICKQIACENSYGRQIGPENVIPNLQSRQFFSGFGEILYVRHEILQDSELFAVARTASIPGAVLKSYIALPCQHSYHGVTDYKGQLSTDPRRLQKGRFSAGFRRDSSSLEPKFSTLYQKVDNNELGQWLAYEDARDGRAICILQRETRLNCILDRIVRATKLNTQDSKKVDGPFTKSGHRSKIFVIAGRLDQ